MPTKETVLCRTPTAGKNPTRIAKAKFDLVRKALLGVVPRKEGILFSELVGQVEGELTPSELESVGSLTWYVTTVKLELEVRGELARVEGSKPQRLIRVAAKK